MGWIKMVYDTISRLPHKISSYHHITVVMQCHLYFAAKYQKGSKYFRTARLPERIIPEIIPSFYRGEVTYTIDKFSDVTGTHCTTCYQITDCGPDGQCDRCYMIDMPDEFERQYWAPKTRPTSFNNGPHFKFAWYWRKFQIFTHGEINPHQLPMYELIYLYCKLFQLATVMFSFFFDQVPNYYWW